MELLVTDQWHTQIWYYEKHKCGIVERTTRFLGLLSLPREQVQYVIVTAIITCVPAAVSCQATLSMRLALNGMQSWGTSDYNLVFLCS